MRINVKKEDIDTKVDELKDKNEGNEVEFLKQGEPTDADVLFAPIQSIIIDYVKKPEKHTNQFKYQKQLTLLGNITACYATEIAHNLLWHIDVDKTLKLAKQYPNSLLIEVEVKDPYGQRVRGKPLQILAAAGDRNPKKMPRDYGLVEKLRPCFKNREDYYQQLKEWFGRDPKKSQTQKTMAPYTNAMRALYQEILESKEITEDIPFESLLKLEMAEKFKKALTPDPDHVVTSGLLFDIKIFLDFLRMWMKGITDSSDEKEHSNLGPLGSLKSDLFAAIVLPTLQARLQRIDLEIFKKGFWNVVNADHHIPKPIDFSNGIPADLIGLGNDFFFGFNGKKADKKHRPIHNLILEGMPESCPFPLKDTLGLMSQTSFLMVFQIFGEFLQAKTSTTDLWGPDRTVFSPGVRIRSPYH